MYLILDYLNILPKIYGHKKKVCLEQNISIGTTLKIWDTNVHVNVYVDFQTLCTAKTFFSICSTRG